MDKETVQPQSDLSIIERNDEIELGDALSSSQDHGKMPHELRRLPHYVARYLRTSWINLTRPSVQPGCRCIERVCISRHLDVYVVVVLIFARDMESSSIETLITVS